MSSAAPGTPGNEPVAPKRPRNWWSFRLRTILCLLGVVAIPLAYVANWRAMKIREHAAATRLKELGGSLELPIAHSSRSLPNPEPVWLKYVVPAESISRVQAFSTSYRPLNDELLGQLVYLRNLRVLKLGSHRPAEVHFQKLTGLPQLSDLFLDCDVTDDEFACFRNQRSLQRLELIDQPITDRSLLQIAQYSELIELRLDGCEISDAGLSHLAGLHKLDHLSLRRTRITSAGLQHLAKLPALTKLYLDETQIDDAAIPQLTKLAALSVLSVERSRVSPRGVEELRTCSRNWIVF